MLMGMSEEAVPLEEDWCFSDEWKLFQKRTFYSGVKIVEVLEEWRVVPRQTGAEE
jgi:hypothetical protein